MRVSAGVTTIASMASTGRSAKLWAPVKVTCKAVAGAQPACCWRLQQMTNHVVVGLRPKIGTVTWAGNVSRMVAVR